MGRKLRPRGGGTRQLVLVPQERLGEAGSASVGKLQTEFVRCPVEEMLLPLVQKGWGPESRPEGAGNSPSSSLAAFL